MAVSRRPVQSKRSPGQRRRRAVVRASYHHGDLRAALLAAAERELAEKGVEGFTLRGCARRAGVTHAAPAHHFKDVRALLTEMATIGFIRLPASMRARARNCPPGSSQHIVAIAKGYVAFAADSPHFFHLIFRIGLLDADDARYKTAGADAFMFPVRAVGALYGCDDPMTDPTLAARVMALWSIVHGFSELMLAGQFQRASGGDRMALVDDLLPRVVAGALALKPKRRRRRDQIAGGARDTGGSGHP
jgi:AcrR family transcriptional regulator